MKKKNYTGPVTEFVALRPIYEILDIVVSQSRDGAGEGGDGEILSNEHTGGSWEDIWGAQ